MMEELFIEFFKWINESPVRWKTMWDAKEYTTQLFFLFNFIAALYITSLPLRSSGKDIALLNRTIMLVSGIGYAILVLFAYLQLVPTFSPYG